MSNPAISKHEKYLDVHRDKLDNTLCKVELDAFLKKVVQAENSFCCIKEMSLTGEGNKKSRVNKSLKISRVYYRHNKDKASKKIKCLEDESVKEIHRRIGVNISVAFLMRENA
jgi:hypothetical protein